MVVPFGRRDAVIENLAKVRQLEAALDAEIAACLKLPGDIAELLASDQVAYED